MLLTTMILRSYERAPARASERRGRRKFLHKMDRWERRDPPLRLAPGNEHAGGIHR